MRFFTLIGLVAAMLLGGLFLKGHTVTVEVPWHKDTFSPPSTKLPSNDFSEELKTLEDLVRSVENLRIPVAYREKFNSLREETDHPGAQTKKHLAALRTELTEILEAENTKPKVAITFDAGAGSAPARELIATLRKTGIKITFFSTGKWANENPDLFRNILIVVDKTRNELGNHTWDHPHFISGNLSDDDIRNEIIRAETTFATLGFTAKPLFRYPYGEHDARTDALVASLGYRVVGWSFDALGWQHQLTAEQIADRAVGKTKPGSIILMHVGSQEDVDALPLIIERLQHDYRFVFVSEL